MSDKTIRTFVVFDMETNNFPSYQFNKCSITEISFYAFSADNVHNVNIEAQDIPKENFDGFCSSVIEPPELPRCLHKLTMMINPLRPIHPDAEEVTELSNEMLEHESPFDENTAECLNLFLSRLEGPICLVAHNGMGFDFPNLRYVYDRINMSLPSSVYCIDSLKAFREIDEKRDKLADAKKKINEIPSSSEHVKEEQVANIEQENNEIIIKSDTRDPLVENSCIDWQLKNETTPHRKIKIAEKRSHNACSDNNLSVTNSSLLKDKHFNNLRACRSLFAENYTPKTKYTKPGEYKLGAIYKRNFGKEPENLHRAETDVEILTKLILYYGLDFLAYAEERKELFSTVPKLGTRIH